MLRYSSRRLTVIGVFITLLLLVTSGCGLSERLQGDRTPSAVPDELETVWEAWTVLSENYVDKDGLIQSRLSEGAIQEMIATLERGPELITPDQYQLDAPNLGAIWQVWDILAEEYGGKENLDAQVLSDAAIRGMLDALGGPYTSYLSPEAYTLQTEDYSSAFEGIGARVNIVEGRLTIVAPISGSPAEQAGLSTGDVILAVDDESVEGLSLAEAVLKVRGDVGTSVDLLVEHQGQNEPETITIVRGHIQLPTVVWELMPEGAIYIRIQEFLEETIEELDDALRETTSQDVTGLVLDLRFNPGGLLKSTISVASQFLDDGLVLYQIDATGNRTDSQVAPGGLALDIPMVVLVNDFSASAAEVLAGALQDHGRADLIGSRTFGKGSINIMRKLSDGSAIDLTYALWYTPDGELIEGQGLVPDVIVPMDPRVGQGSALDVQLLVARQTLQNKLREPALVG